MRDVWEDNKQDIGNQLIQLREFVAKQQWELEEEFVDTVTGSGKKDRTAFDAMMLAASQRRFDLLLFWKLDRFSREGTRKTLQYLTRLDSDGVAWRSYMEPFFDSCGMMRDVVIGIMATLAEQERISISRGQRRDWTGQDARAKCWAGNLTRWR